MLRGEENPNWKKELLSKVIHQNVGRIAEILELSSIISLLISKVKIELYENKLQKSFI